MLVLEVLEVAMMVERERREGRWLDKGLTLDPSGDFLPLKWAARWRALVVRRELTRSFRVFLAPRRRRAHKKMVKSPMKQRKGPKARLLSQVWCWVSSLGAQATTSSRKPLARSSRPRTKMVAGQEVGREAVANSSPCLVFLCPGLALLAWSHPERLDTARTCPGSSFSTVLSVTSFSWGCSGADI